MGSGNKGGYYGTRGSSQPFASSYGVMPDMRSKDIKEGIYNEQRGYSRNPSAVELLSSMKNNTVYLDGKKANGLYTYVVNEKGELIFGKRNNPNDPSKRSPHPMLIGGKNPKVRCAGMLDIRNGKIFNADTDSGHYKPNELKKYYLLCQSKCLVANLNGGKNEIP
ncbi:hypothetical protein [Fibrobacter sp.]|uniref:hypothetical protein n=1 Tax=Fibrobacter sp. TaxID=35828 RepID=UPI0026070147|nr:hypothetical protein [Fibrobacter sp.]MDD5941460.1 hypothetical protein [Fibrobacter sp.]